MERRENEKRANHLPGVELMIDAMNFPASSPVLLSTTGGLYLRTILSIP